LRVLLTDARLLFASKKIVTGCTHCAKCMEVCPADAIARDTFNGIACRDAHKEMAKKECDGSYI
jgi:ferredoxin